MRSPLRPAAAVLSGLLAACATTPGPRVSLEDATKELASYDVVFLGEEHDNDVGHVQHLQILKLLHSQRPDLVLSMEMFERDVQPVLDDYLAGRIDEKAFVAESRPWPQYATHYRPFVEYAKRHGLRVIAANAPRKLANKVSSGGIEAVAGDPHVARETTAPKDLYWERFQEAMEGHLGVDESTVYRYYQSQCLKDDTMAESIVAAFDGVDPRPLVVHVNGKFHSDERLGTAARVAWRSPGTRIAVLSMDTALDVFRTGDGEFLLRVPAQPEIAEPKVEQPKVETTADEAPAVAAPAVAAPAGEAGRPALGFMPSYDEGVEGVRIDRLVPGGPAEQAGLAEGDVIVQIEDRPVDDVGGYMTVLADLTIGQKVKVKALRGDDEKTFEVTVGQRSN